MTSTLTVTIESFSYKSGIPEESFPHGGGFVFDCRCLPNPGREAAYKDLDGRDQVVREYLERYSEVDKFFEHVTALVQQAVNNYLERGFDSLAVSFGCTGGQHRSVYFAERMAAHLGQHRNIEVVLAHRERGDLQ